MFYYSELLRYNKYFNYFSSLDDIFTTINQCIEENKFFITNSVKCLSFTMQMYISKKKKYYNINVNLNKHKNLKPLSLATKKDIQKVNLGIKSEKELNYAINEIRQRLTKLEKSQRNNNNFSDINIINSDNINSANDTSMNNPNSMAGLNNMMNKLNYLETSINNKDVKIKTDTKCYKYIALYVLVAICSYYYKELPIYINIISLIISIIVFVAINKENIIKIFNKMLKKKRC